jgi:hypothetical protein
MVESESATTAPAYKTRTSVEDHQYKPDDSKSRHVATGERELLSIGWNE